MQKRKRIIGYLCVIAFSIATFTYEAAAQVDSNLDSAANIPELNRKALNFAVQHLGRQVGNGECSALVAAALQSAGARLARGFIFGRELGPHEPWLPGDVIQFTDCLFVEGGAHWQVGTPYHTSIIRSIRGKRVTVLQQNSNRDPRTQEQTLDFDTMVRGSYKVYRPVSDAQPGAAEKDFVQSAHKAPVGNLAEILQQPVVPGPMFQARQEILDKIRNLQAKGVNTYRYRQKFQEIEMRIVASTSNSSTPIASDLTEVVEALRRELVAKSAQ